MNRLATSCAATGPTSGISSPVSAKTVVVPLPPNRYAGRSITMRSVTLPKDSPRPARSAAANGIIWTDSRSSGGSRSSRSSSVRLGIPRA